MNVNLKIGLLLLLYICVVILQSYGDSPPTRRYSRELQNRRHEIIFVSSSSASFSELHFPWRTNTGSPSFLTYRGGGGSSESDENNSKITRKGGSNDDGGFKIVEETILHDNWRKLTRRRVRLPSSQLVADFEVVGSKGTDEAVVVFVWNSSNKTATMIREYMPSVHSMELGLAAGMVEEHKHNTNIGCADDEFGNDPRLTAAKHELEEECRLTGGEWIRLTDRTTMDKYSTTALTVYLVLDPLPVAPEHAKPRDETEEGMEVVAGVTVSEIRNMIEAGELTVVGAWACLCALQKLRDLKEIV